MPAASTSRPPRANGTAVKPVDTPRAEPPSAALPEPWPGPAARAVAVGDGVQIGAEPEIQAGVPDGSELGTGSTVITGPSDTEGEPETIGSGDEDGDGSAGVGSTGPAAGEPFPRAALNRKVPVIF